MPFDIAFYYPQLDTIDLSVGSTETKYIKVKTKAQNDIVIFDIFSKNLYFSQFFSKKAKMKISFFSKNSKNNNIISYDKFQK